MDYSITVDVRLRPIRIGFIVEPDDMPSLKTAFQINTCLWGGRYNPIIPFLRRVPKWWERQGFRFDSAIQIMNGYVDFFEPDIIAEAEKGLAHGLGYDENRIVSFDAILRGSDRRDTRGQGLDVLDLYHDLFRKEFQFVRRNPQRVIDVGAATTGFANFAACLFGGFPTTDGLSHFHQVFKQVFNPEQIKLDGATLLGLYELNPPRPLSASILGSSNLEVDFNDRGYPTLFVLDATQSRDLIDYWNLRAIDPQVIPIPIQWLPELSPFCKEFIKSGYRPLPGNSHGVMRHVTTMFSRSVPEDNIKNIFAKYFQLPAPEAPGANVVQTWYPPIWRPTPEFVSRRTRPTISFGQESFNVPVVDRSISFESLHPGFAERFGGQNRWANVVRLKDWNRRTDIAVTFPTDVRKRSLTKFVTGPDQPISTAEGLVDLRQFKELSNVWQTSDGAGSISHWLKGQQVAAKLSESGRSAEQIIHTLKGFWGVGAIAHSGIVKLLDQMSRKPITHSAHRHEFENKINLAVGKDFWRRSTFETLVSRRAVELGYELKCSKCGSWGWYSLASIAPIIVCGLCLKEFDFPVSDPSNSDHARWAYRVVGPFALPQYANGGYAAALALRFFERTMHGIVDSSITWAGGHELAFSDGKKAEVDFIDWSQRSKMFKKYLPTEVVFGEAKSFGKEAFAAKDIERMRLLAERFHGSVFVFATMKEAEDLSAKELRLIRSFAEWGRQYDREQRRLRAPVILLTGTELFLPYDLTQTWKEKGGPRGQLVAPGHVSADRLLTLADLTQQAYLNMPSYSSWRQERWQKRLAKRKKSVVQDQVASAK